GRFRSCEKMTRPKISPRTQTSSPPMRSERPFIPRNWTCPRSGILRLASPPAGCPEPSAAKASGGMPNDSNAMTSSADTDMIRARRDMELFAIMSRSPARENGVRSDASLYAAHREVSTTKTPVDASEVIELTRFVGDGYVQEMMVTEHEPSPPEDAQREG